MMGDMDKPTVFISWSGDRSGAIAKALRAWIPDVLRSAEVFVSSEDIGKGKQWLAEIGRRLSANSFGLLIVTPENRERPWLLFEAGAMSRALPENNCSPVLFELKHSDIAAPLSLLNGTLLGDVDDMLKLVLSMARAFDAGSFDEVRITGWFKTFWPELQQKLKTELAKVPQPGNIPQRRTAEEILDEILETVRRIDGQEYEALVKEEFERRRRRETRIQAALKELASDNMQAAIIRERAEREANRDD